MNPNVAKPPRWATAILRWYCKRELLEDLEGDLFEFYTRNVTKHGKSNADLIYIVDVIKFIRPYTFKALTFDAVMIRLIMLESYFKTSSRVLVRNRLFSAINLIGLSISMSTGLILLAMLSDLQKYDKHHEGYSQIYRVNSLYQYENNPSGWIATTSLKAAQSLSSEFAGTLSVGTLYKQFKHDFRAGDKTVPLEGFWANQGLMNVFTFEFIAGDKATALATPFTAVITESANRKLFGDQSGMGKFIRNNDRDYTITGIIKDPPFFSHFDFEVLTSLKSQDVLSADPNRHEWGSVWDTWAYVRTHESSSQDDLNGFLSRWAKKENRASDKVKVALTSQSLGDIMSSEKVGNQIGPVVGSTLPWMLTALVVIVTLSAFFNYTNLSIARTMRRVREIGTRKVFGARRLDIIFQFVSEGILVSFLALTVAFAGCIFLKPFFLTVEPEISSLFRLDLSLELVGLFILFALFVGLLAGLIPSLYFAGRGMLDMLKGKLAQSHGKFGLRQALITSQFSISVILVTACVGVFHQYQHFLFFDLGFRTSNIFNLELQGNDADRLTNEIAKFPEVEGISRSAVVTSLGSFWGTQVAYARRPNETIDVALNLVDENYLRVHEFTLLAGRHFERKAETAPRNEIIVNRHFIERLGVGDGTPQGALGEVVMYDNNALTIVGVLENFQYGRANTEVTREVVLMYSPKECNHLNIALAPGNTAPFLSRIREAWKKSDDVHPFLGEFYSEQLRDAFSGLNATMKVSGFLSILALVISSLGLLGMVIFSTQIRQREIGIRKVLGASSLRLTVFLGGQFLLLLGIAAVSGVAITSLVFTNLMFPSIPNHAPLNIAEMIGSALAVVGLATLIISSQTSKISTTNPTEVLRSE